MNNEETLAEGARNLVVNCAGLQQGETVLIVSEHPSLGWYDEIVPSAVVTEIRKHGIEPDVLEVGAPGSGFDEKISRAVSAHDLTIFFARFGDQNRFAAPLPGTRTVMCYARFADMLASSYGRSHYNAFYDFKNAVNEILFNAKKINITCPLGTNLSGTPPQTEISENAEVSVLRFPLGVPQPMETENFSGIVALTHYLTPTGSNVYEPPSVKLDEIIFAHVEHGRIVDFEGPKNLVDRVRDHYKNVSDQFAIDPDTVHSWHAGIHPGCASKANADDDPDRWSNTVFTNPRVLHFHTCGNYAPGEICWMVLDHNVSVDGVTLWEHGRLRPENFPQTKNCLNSWPELVVLFANPSDAIGLDS